MGEGSACVLGSGSLGGLMADTFISRRILLIGLLISLLIATGCGESEDGQTSCSVSIQKEQDAVAGHAVDELSGVASELESLARNTGNISRNDFDQPAARLRSLADEIKRPSIRLVPDDLRGQQARPVDLRN